MAKQVDSIIIGQGLAGSCLALELRRRGQSFLVVDRQDEHSSSRVAAGLITPITGKGMNPSPRQDEFLQVAVPFYRQLENQVGQTFYHSSEVLRLFSGEKEFRKFERKLQTQNGYDRWVAGEANSAAGVKAEHGGFAMRDGGWLDTRKFLAVVSELLAGENRWLEADFSADELDFSADGVSWRDWRAQRVILCLGAYGLGSGPFDYIPHRSAKGEILSLRIPLLQGSQRYHRGGWLAARENGLWKAGASYDWDQLDSEPTGAGREKVEGIVQSFTDAAYEVVAHEAAVRPIVRCSQPVCGLHPAHRQLGFFNGLGSKGSLVAPLVASQFAEYLATGKPVDDDFDLAKIFPPATSES
ncbi:NAD(P)/FAD-dependent oxidoreductase [Persicirhabdus sediminis]|uniref:FAD-binding oxidoreductase n=1 Tax=Persicirhabdus sediminis TaxID=454144 RepID=A0A8J7MBU6_9BACT|nr:FAD-binding oxidoreductase [Persicirhabdus sediminis]MBK1789718.1 FAD-binding oxidoreductase [Persicirhabdus sediminis]